MRPRPAPDAARIPGKKQRKQDDRAEIRYRRAGDDQLPERGLGLAGVGEHRDHDPKRGRRKDDRHEQRGLYEIDGVEPEADGQRNRQGDHETGGRATQPRAPQTIEVDLEPSQKQQERETEQG